MGKVDIDINKKHYPIGCEDGQEDHIRQLGRHVDHHVKQLCRNVGDLGETRLLLMAALMITDELHEARQLIDSLQRAQNAPPTPPEPLMAQPAAMPPAEMARAIDLFEHATARLERLRKTLEGQNGA